MLWGLAGAALFQLQSIVDGVDGELARLLHKESRFGFWYDVGVDNVTHMAVFAGSPRARPPAACRALGRGSARARPCSASPRASRLMAPLLDPARKRAARRAPKAARALQEPASTGSAGAASPGCFPAGAARLAGGFLWAAAIGTWVYATAALVLRVRERVAAPAT